MADRVRLYSERRTSLFLIGKDSNARGKHRHRISSSTRTETRKVPIVGERTQPHRSKRRRLSGHRNGRGDGRSVVPPGSSQNDDSSGQDAEFTEEAHVPKSHAIGQKTSSQPLDPDSSASEDDDVLHVGQEQRKISRAAAERLAADDAEIRALERKLGIKKRKQPGESFNDDDLFGLLGNDEDSGSEAAQKKKQAAEADEWLQRKRKRSKITRALVSVEAAGGKAEESGGISSSVESALEETQSLTDGSSNGDPRQQNLRRGKKPKAQKENPYLPAPLPDAATGATSRYLPPSRRPQDVIDSEGLGKLRKQIKGTLNRLSESNILGITAEIEKLYRDNARQHVSTLLLDAFFGLVADTAPLQDTFMILHGAFLSALHRTLGNEIAAQAIERLVNELEKTLKMQVEGGAIGKKLSNMVALLAEMYNFQIIGSNLMYDYIRIFVADISEGNTELLLKIAKLSGSQLRQDDPSSLKDIAMLLNAAVKKLGSENLSVRTKFMVETIEDLKNGRTKVGQAASSIVLEHTTRMKKTLGTLKRGNVLASEPLQLTLKDIRESDKRGKWWLIGASYRDKTRDDLHGRTNSSSFDKSSQGEATTEATIDLLQLARHERMNTDIRRTIFVTILSANDYKDATERLLKLRLKKSQELEIPKVIIHCASAEKSYNPFYALLSEQLCGKHKLQMAFQFCAWDLFKRLEHDKDGDTSGTDDHLDLRAIVNLAKLYGSLIAVGKLKLSVLKVGALFTLQKYLTRFARL